MSNIAFIFPGQGSQVVGMGNSFLEHPIAQQLFQEANDALGFDLKKLCAEGPAEELTLTQNAQPAILTVSVIAYRIFSEKKSLQPSFAAGHSLGEYTALVASGVLSFQEAVKTVHLRGKFMQEAVPVGVGTMAAILGMTEDKLETICEEEANGEVVSPANYNTRGQIVIAGHTEAVKRVLARGKGKLLDVSAPFHSSLMAPAAEKLSEHLKTISFSPAQFPIINNVANQALSNQDEVLSSLIEQMTGAVRWETGIKKMIAEGVDTFIEFGEGKILSSMMKRIDKTVTVHSISSLEDVENVSTQV